MPGPTIPPPNAYTAPQLRQLIYYHLDNDMLPNARFFAGRLHALDSKDSKGDSAHLLALCHLRLGDVKAAYEASRDRVFSGRTPHLGCAYVFAKACVALERYSEGITALERSKSQWAGRNHWSECCGAGEVVRGRSADQRQTNIRTPYDDICPMLRPSFACSESCAGRTRRRIRRWNTTSKR